MNAKEIAEKLNAKFSGAVLETKEDSVQPWIKVKADMILEITKFLREDESLQFDFLRSVASVDYKKSLS